MSSGRRVHRESPKGPAAVPRSVEDPREAKARDRARIRTSAEKAEDEAQEDDFRRNHAHAPRTNPHKEHRLAQARHVDADPLPDHARRAPVLRANPYPEVTDPICRLPLPTLVYRLEAFHLGDLLRIWVRAGATSPRSPLPDFQGPRGRPGHRRNCGALRVPNPISLLEDSRELERLCRTENSARVSRRRLRVLLGYPDELPPWKGGRPEETVPLPGSGIGTGFPFAPREHAFSAREKTPRINIGFLLGLRID